MTIAKRLTILIVVAIASLILVGLVGLRQMGAINDNLRYAHENSIPSIKKIDSIEASFFRLRINALGLMLATTDEQRKVLEDRITTRRQELAQHVKDYEGFISDDKDRQYLEETKALLKDYYPILDNVLTSIHAGQPDKAKSGMDKATELSIKLADNIEAHGKYNESLAEQEV